MCQKEEDMSSYKEGQVHQLMERLEAEGFTPDDVTKLGQYENLSDIRGHLKHTEGSCPVGSVTVLP